MPSDLHESVADRHNPYRIEGPALMSISGGRTSAFMLRQILDAHGGDLPGDVIPVFCNTGLEHEATFQFLREIERQWKVPIVWLEYRYRPDAERKHDFDVVDYCLASREGEPFSQLIAARSMLPNLLIRFCTVELKINTAHRYAKHLLGWKQWAGAIGLRYDEPWRVAKLKGDPRNEDAECPMASAGHVRADVLAFWKAQPFDLELPGDDDAFGNCQLCFLKAKRKIAKVMRTNPDAARWWIEQEEAHADKRPFRFDRPTYRQMLTQVTVQGQLYDDAIEDDTMPCMCHE